MIVRKEPGGELLIVAQTDHSRLAGQFAAHWGNAQFATPKPYESVARAAAFHDFGYLRYETAPMFDAETGETPNFRNVTTTAQRLEEYAWCSEWLLEPDPYAAIIVNMHRCGLWRGRYDAMKHPPHAIRKQSPQVDAFVERNEAAQKAMLAQHGWDANELRINYRLLQVWDNLSLYFSCQDPFDEYLEPVPTSYDCAEGEGARITLTPAGKNRVKLDPYPFARAPLAVQLIARRFPQTTFANEAAFRKAYYSAPLEIVEYVLIA